MDASQWTRLQRAKILATSTNLTMPNTTGDVLLERTFGIQSVRFMGREVKPCCSSITVPDNLAIILVIDTETRSIILDAPIAIFGGSGYVDIGDGNIVAWSGSLQISTIAGPTIKIYSSTITLFAYEGGLLTSLVLDPLYLTTLAQCTLGGTNSNGNITALSFAGLTGLTDLSVYDYALTSIDLNGAVALTTLNLDYNQLTSLQVHGLPNLIELSCGNNQLTSIDVASNTQLTSISIQNNQLTSLDLSSNLVLESVSIHNNLITELDVLLNTELKYVSIYNNQFTVYTAENVVGNLLNHSITNGTLYVNQPEGPFVIDTTGQAYTALKETLFWLVDEEEPLI